MKSNVALSERQIIKASCEGFLTDTLLYADDASRKQAKQFEKSFWDSVQELHEILLEAFMDARIKVHDRFAFATTLKRHVKPMYHRYFYAIYDKKDVLQFLIDDVTRYSKSKKGIEKIKQLLAE